MYIVWYHHHPPKLLLQNRQKTSTHTQTATLSVFQLFPMIL